MPKYGLTGGIAGKTVALQIFNEYGVDTIDTDELARLVIDRGTEGARNLEEAIGEQYFLMVLWNDSDCVKTCTNRRH